ncbi:hypothetical protein DFH07DRAFT_784458 [Mycena maculata]|uniref:Uncharacterized protein n=1 Tax=Mycena maculata TaxID=230809 RepID=A0AAD7HGF6_9AGAR|nr:hypothetical protein DFH07DRAFT_784458 [Mycena maculata]
MLPPRKHQRADSLLPIAPAALKLGETTLQISTWGPWDCDRSRPELTDIRQCPALSKPVNEIVLRLCKRQHWTATSAAVFWGSRKADDQRSITEILHVKISAQDPHECAPTPTPALHPLHVKAPTRQTPHAQPQEPTLSHPDVRTPNPACQPAYAHLRTLSLSPQTPHAHLRPLIPSRPNTSPPSLRTYLRTARTPDLVHPFTHAQANAALKTVVRKAKAIFVLCSTAPFTLDKNHNQTYHRHLTPRAQPRAPISTSPTPDACLRVPLPAHPHTPVPFLHRLHLRPLAPHNRPHQALVAATTLSTVLALRSNTTAPLANPSPLWHSRSWALAASLRGCKHGTHCSHGAMASGEELRPRRCSLGCRILASCSPHSRRAHLPDCDSMARFNGDRMPFNSCPEIALHSACLTCDAASGLLERSFGLALRKTTASALRPTTLPAQDGERNGKAMGDLASALRPTSPSFAQYGECNGKAWVAGVPMSGCPKCRLCMEPSGLLEQDASSLTAMQRVGLRLTFPSLVQDTSGLVTFLAPGARFSCWWTTRDVHESLFSIFVMLCCARALKLTVPFGRRKRRAERVQAEMAWLDSVSGGAVVEQIIDEKRGGKTHSVQSWESADAVPVHQRQTQAENGAVCKRAGGETDMKSAFLIEMDGDKDKSQGQNGLVLCAHGMTNSMRLRGHARNFRAVSRQISARERPLPNPSDLGPVDFQLSCQPSARMQNIRMLLTKDPRGDNRKKKKLKKKKPEQRDLSLSKFFPDAIHPESEIQHYKDERPRKESGTRCLNEFPKTYHTNGADAFQIFLDQQRVRDPRAGACERGAVQPRSSTAHHGGLPPVASLASKLSALLLLTSSRNLKSRMQQRRERSGRLAFKFETRKVLFVHSTTINYQGSVSMISVSITEVPSTLPAESAKPTFTLTNVDGHGCLGQPARAWEVQARGRDGQADVVNSAKDADRDRELRGREQLFRDSDSACRLFNSLKNMPRTYRSTALDPLHLQARPEFELSAPLRTVHDARANLRMLLAQLSLSDDKVAVVEEERCPCRTPTRVQGPVSELEANMDDLHTKFEAALAHLEEETEAKERSRRCSRRLTSLASSIRARGGERPHEGRQHAAARSTRTATSKRSSCRMSKTLSPNSKLPALPLQSSAATKEHSSALRAECRTLDVKESALQSRAVGGVQARGGDTLICALLALPRWSVAAPSAAANPDAPANLLALPAFKVCWRRA